MRYDLDAEFMNAGFWPGDDNAPDPIFYAYIHPKPEGCELAPIDPHGAAWIEQMGEWVMRAGDGPRVHALVRAWRGLALVLPRPDDGVDAL